MKIVEAMKELKLIEKKMEKNADSIQKYSSQPSNERPYFSTEDAQRKEIKSLIQSNIDLLNNYLGLKKSIEKTNLETQVEFDGKKYTISELLVLKRRLAKMMIVSFDSMNDSNARQNMIRGTGDNTIKIERFYDEREKNEGLRKWQDFYDNIDSRLEVVNATTDLID